MLYHGNRVLPGAIGFFNAIRQNPHAFITNNPRITPDQVRAKLNRMGFELSGEAPIVTSALATAQWLQKEKAGFRFYAVGEHGLQNALTQFGKEDPSNADFVVIGEGRGLDFDSLTTGINLILKDGAKLVATNPDINVDDDCGGGHCIVPGCGALTAPFEKATGVEATVIGKPEPLLYQMALERLGAKPEHSIMIGDRPDTDIVGAARIGMRTALVRTGRFSPGDPYPENLPRPDWDVNNLTELWEEWRSFPLADDTV